MASPSAAAEPSQPVKTGKKNEGVFNNIMIPYAIAILVQLPMLLLYSRSLLKDRPHYHFAPFAVLAVIVLAYSRWPKEQSSKFHKSTWSGILLVLGLISGIMGWLFMEPNFAAYSVALLVTSLLARTVDPETNKSLWACALPLYVAMVPPMNLDVRLITWLQRVSAVFTSRLLDLLQFGHHMPGTVIQLPGNKQYGIEQACSGVVSFFTLLFVAVVFIVWNRRPWFRGLLLMIAAVFWALFMNTVRIMIIPIVDQNLGIDLSSGIQHDILGWAVLLMGIFLLFSTDQFLLFLFGPVETSTGQSGPFGRLLTAIWNNVLAGDSEGEKRRRRRRQPVSKFGRTAIWSTAAVLALLGVMQVVDLARSWNQPDLKVKFFDSDVTLPFEESDLPTEITSVTEDGNTIKWTQVGYKPEDRSRGSDLGLRSDVWSFNASRCRAMVSMDQTFPGWHELTTCYRNQGWKLVKRDRRVAPISDENDTEWPYIEAHFERDTGEKGYLLFSHFDAFGEPFDAPAEWGTINSFIVRASNRLTHRIRGRLFRGEAYQTQVFSAQFSEFDADLQKEITAQYLQIRSIYRDRFMEKRNGAVASTGTSAEESATPSP